VEVDEGQMSQVINNLIINADQAMPEGGVIMVSTENVVIDEKGSLPLSPGRYVRISIRDQGIGIPESHIAKIFDPYFSTKEKGSGIGLTTVYSIIKKHDGHITVESKVGAGSVFYIYLPASENKPAAKEKKEEAELQGEGRILVMDDDEIIREVAGVILGHLGYNTVYCRDGAEAVEEYKKAMETGESFAAVLMDLTIPGGMGGKEAMKCLLELDPQARGIVSSGYSNDPILANYREYGFSGVVLKPYDMEELGRTLHKIIKQ
jgi:CheY-like chemotaxis protein